MTSEPPVLGSQPSAGDAVPDLPERFDQHYLDTGLAIQGPEPSARDAALAARLLELAPGALVLDVPCAFGRIANQLATLGYRVTGLDAKQLFLDHARRDAAALGVEVEYVAGDLRALPDAWAGRFDAAVNWFSSFGYFDDATDRRVLAGWRRVLRPGGRLLLDLVAPGHDYRRLPVGAKGFDGPVIRLEDGLIAFRQGYDPVTGRHRMERTVARGGRVHTHTYHIRHFSFPELRDWLLGAGFARVDPYGDGGGPLTTDSTRMLVVAHA